MTPRSSLRWVSREKLNAFFSDLLKDQRNCGIWKIMDRELVAILATHLLADLK